MSRLPSVTPRQAVAALKRAGYEDHLQKGSHLYLWHDNSRRMTCVPMHPGDFHRGVLKRILKQAGLTEEQFRELL